MQHFSTSVVLSSRKRNYTHIIPKFKHNFFLMDWVISKKFSFLSIEIIINFENDVGKVNIKHSKRICWKISNFYFTLESSGVISSQKSDDKHNKLCIADCTYVLRWGGKRKCRFKRFDHSLFRCKQFGIFQSRSNNMLNQEI